MRTRAKVDTNQKQIVTALRKCGYSVLHLHALGKGAPDILVGVAGKNYLFEIKDGTRIPSEQKLTPDEKRFHSEWSGHVCIVNSLDELLNNIYENAPNMRM